MVIYRTGYIIRYARCPIIWASRIQTEIKLSTTEAEYIDLSQSTRDVSPFMNLMKEIKFIIKLQGYTPTVLCSIFENPVTPVTVYKDNQQAIALVVYL